MAETRTRTRTVQPVAPADDEVKDIDMLTANVPAIGRKDPLGTGSALAAVIADAQARFGVQTMFRASYRPTFKFVPTGVFAFDFMTKGGIPVGLGTGFIGQKSAGKSTQTLKVICAFQKMFPDQCVVLIDIEGTFDPIWASKHGVDIERLVIVQPSSGEQACDVADAVVRTPETSLVVVDSLAGLLPKKELESSIEDSMMGKRGGMTSRFCAKVQQAMLDERKKDHWVTVVLINQYRMSMAMYGSPYSEPGGMGPGYLYSQQYQLRTAEVVVDKKLSFDARGADLGLASHNEITFTKKKNKLMNGVDEAVTRMIRNPYHPLGAGFFDEAKTVLTEAKKLGMISERPPYVIQGLDGEKFKSLDEMVSYCYSDLDFYAQFQLGVIDHARAAQGLEAGMQWLATGG